MKNEIDIKKAVRKGLEEGKVLIGARESLRGLKNGDVALLVYAKNCPEEIKNDLAHFETIEKDLIKEFEGDSVQLGTFCGKPFNIVVLAIKK